MAGLLAGGSSSFADLPSFPVVSRGINSPLTVAGAAADSEHSFALTAFPFDPDVGNHQRADYRSITAAVNHFHHFLGDSAVRRASVPASDPAKPLPAGTTTGGIDSTPRALLANLSAEMARSKQIIATSKKLMAKSSKSTDEVYVSEVTSKCV
jgi:hypothetical protein